MLNQNVLRKKFGVPLLVACGAWTGSALMGKGRTMAEAEAWVMIPIINEDKTGCDLTMYPLVLCKDCKFYNSESDAHGDYCDRIHWSRGLNWFCGDGRRKD